MHTHIRKPRVMHETNQPNLPNISNKQTPKRNQSSGTNGLKGGGFSRCKICGEISVPVSCIDCLTIFCINCGIVHSKQNLNHNVTSIKDTHVILTEQVRNLEEQLNKINQQLHNKPSSQKHQIDCQIFDNNASRLKILRKQAESMISTFFDRIETHYVTLWSNFIDLWGNSKTFQDKINSINQKLNLFLTDNVQEILNQIESLFKEKVLQQTKQVIEQFEKREQIQQSDDSTILYPPRLIVDLSCMTKLNLQLQQMVQVFDWQTQQQQENQYTIQGQVYQSLPLIPTNAKVMYLYDLETCEYQIGEFQDLRHQQLPYNVKTIFTQDGTLYLVGGADEKGNPVKQMLKCNDGDLQNLASLPKSKNPTNGLILYDKYIFVIGGLKIEDKKLQWTKSCEKYNIQENKWYQLESMNYPKPHQTVFRINQTIYAMGFQQQEFLNFEKYDIILGKWSLVTLPQTSINPFLFGGGYASVTMNETQALIFGGKQWNRKFLDDDQEYYFDDEILKTVFCFDQNENKFFSFGDCMTGTNVSYGEFTPICHNNKIIHFSSPISKQRKIHQWLQFIEVVQMQFVNSTLEAEIIQILTPD